MELAKIIADAIRIGMESRNVDVESDYKVLQHFFLSDPETRRLFVKELTYGECCEIAQELDTSMLAKLIVIKEDGE
jgi:hypothetical protein